MVLSGVGEPFLDQNIRYHCPIYCVYNFDKIISPAFKRHIYLYHQGDYQTLYTELNETDWNSLKDDNVDLYAQNVNDRITHLVNKHISNKTVHVRKSDPSWLTTNIKRLMRKRKRYYDQYRRTKNQSDFNFNNYKHIRNQVTSLIRKAKQQEIDNLKDKLKDPNIDRNDWWKTLKTFIKPDQTFSIPPLKCNDTVICDEKRKADKLNDFFTQQTHLDEHNAQLPQTFNNPPNKLDLIRTTAVDVTPIPLLTHG